MDVTNIEDPLVWVHDSVALLDPDEFAYKSCDRVLSSKIVALSQYI